MGWIGYDFIPVTVIMILTIRWLYYSGENNSKYLDSLLYAARDCGWLISGVSWSILLHLFQNSLYYGNLEIAVKDLFGAAAVRMDNKLIAQKFSPSYYYDLTHMVSYSAFNALNYEYPFLTSGLFSYARNVYSFFSRHNYVWFIPAFILVLALKLVFFFRSNELCAKKIFFIKIDRALIFIFLIIMSSSIWCLLMPLHAFYHSLIISRHLFVTTLGISFSFPLWNIRDDSGEVNLTIQKKSFHFLIQVIPIAILFSLFIYCL